MNHVPDSHQRFATTRWSVIRQAAGPGNQEKSRKALSELLQSYWSPLYAYLRRTGLSSNDSEDIVQGFFASLLGHNDFEGLSPEKGRFRSFMLASLKNFLSNQRDRERRLKRGGGKKLISFQVDEVEGRVQLIPTHTLTAEVIFEQEWAMTVLNTVCEHLQQEYIEKGKGEQYQHLSVYLTGDRNAPSYQEVSETLGMSEGAVKMAVNRMRTRYGELLRSEIAETVTTEEQIEDELRHLISALQFGSG